MARRVPLARRNLLAERRRLALSLLGVGAAVALILLLQGLWSGTRHQISAYEDNVGADLYVAQKGTKNFATDNSIVPASLASGIQKMAGVDAAAPIIARYMVLDLHDRKLATVLIGSVPGEMGGPWELSAGRAVEADDEVAIDEVTAERHDLSVGDTLSVMGHDLEVVGLVRGARTWMTGITFASLDAVQQMQGTPGVASLILVDTNEPAAIAAEIRTRDDVTVLTAREIADNERSFYAGILAGPIDLMIAIAFLAGVLIVALTVYSSIVERIREYGIVKAVGARGRDVLRVVLGQTVLIAVAGTAAGFIIYALGANLIESLRPQFWSHLSLPASAIVVASSLLMALLAAIVPTKRLLRVDPASVYRG